MPAGVEALSASDATMSATYLRLAGVMLFWGGNVVAGRVLAQELSPFSAAVLRFTAANIFLWGYGFAAGLGLARVGRTGVVLGAVLGLFGVAIYNYCYFSGLALIPAARVGAIVAAIPATVATVSFLMGRERLRGLGWAGVALAFFGAVTVISQGEYGALLSGQVGAGELFILGCVAAWTVYSLRAGRAMDEMGPLRAVAWSCLVGWALLLPGAVAEDVFVHLGDISALGWLCVVHLGFLGSGVAYVWYFKGIRDVGATRAAVFINLVPALAIGLGMLLLGERLLLIEIFGAVCAMLGVWLVNRARTTT